jgi:hypothetical protein
MRKTYVITVAKNFLSNHPKKGTPTDFENKIISGMKRHTIRANYDYWSKIVEKCKAGEALISIRQWSGRPYQSKQFEICQCLNPEIQKIHFTKGTPETTPTIYIGQRSFFGEDFNTIARNDGFEDVQDFLDWFPHEFDGGIIHLGPNKY